MRELGGWCGGWAARTPVRRAAMAERAAAEQIGNQMKTTYDTLWLSDSAASAAFFATQPGGRGSDNA